MKAAEHSRTPGPGGVYQRIRRRGSVMECGCALPLSGNTHVALHGDEIR
jgi:hypothetical protein